VVHAIKVCPRRIVGCDEPVVDAGEPGRRHGGIGASA
jgi:hypothetical protein